MGKIQVRFEIIAWILMLICSGLAGMACVAATGSFICGLAVAILTLGLVYFCTNYLAITFSQIRH